MIIARFSQAKASLLRFVASISYRAKIFHFFKKYDKRIKKEYLSKRSFEHRVDCLASYFVTSFILSSDECYSRAYYSGAFSEHSRDTDSIEGASRFLPLLASLVARGEGVNFDLMCGRSINLVDVIKTSLVSGTDPMSKFYWGNVENFDQKIVEAADIALAIWISRGSVWEKLGEGDQSAILSWLELSLNKDIVDNNWHFFPLLISMVINQLDSTKPVLINHYDRIKQFYVGDGWFSDGEGEKFDYYNAWAFHYSLYWINNIDPNFDQEFIKVSSGKFSEKFKFFFGKNGFPFFGRSVCYRLAAPAPLIASYLMKLDVVDEELAARSFDATWKHFIENDALTNGVPTQGYYEKDLDFLDNYSGPASSLWSLRSLILLLQIPRGTGFWREEAGQLPIGVEKFRHEISSIKAVIEMREREGAIKLSWLNRERQNSFIKEKNGIMIKVKSFLIQTPKRPENELIKNNLKTYSSDFPLTRDRAEGYRG